MEIEEMQYSAMLFGEKSTGKPPGRVKRKRTGLPASGHR
jgi:hypothetical protein